jgi:hypothetical protein
MPSSRSVESPEPTRFHLLLRRRVGKGSASPGQRSEKRTLPPIGGAARRHGRMRIWGIPCQGRTRVDRFSGLPVGKWQPKSRCWRGLEYINPGAGSAFSRLAITFPIQARSAHVSGQAREISFKGGYCARLYSCSCRLTRESVLCKPRDAGFFRNLLRML